MMCQLHKYLYTTENPKHVAIVLPTRLLAWNIYHSLANHVKKMKHNISVGYSIDKKLINQGADILVVTIGYLQLCTSRLIVFD
jgi:superfamily II DNA/RNA helicase